MSESLPDIEDQSKPCRATAVFMWMNRRRGTPEDTMISLCSLTPCGDCIRARRGNLRLDGDKNNVHPVVGRHITKDWESYLWALKVNAIAEGLGSAFKVTQCAQWAIFHARHDESEIVLRVISLWSQVRYDISSFRSDRDRR